MPTTVAGILPDVFAEAFTLRYQDLMVRLDPLYLLSDTEAERYHENHPEIVLLARSHPDESAFLWELQPAQPGRCIQKLVRAYEQESVWRSAAQWRQLAENATTQWDGRTLTVQYSEGAKTRSIVLTPISDTIRYKLYLACGWARKVPDVVAVLLQTRAEHCVAAYLETSDPRAPFVDVYTQQLLHWQTNPHGWEPLRDDELSVFDALAFEDWNGTTQELYQATKALAR